MNLIVEEVVERNNELMRNSIQLSGLLAVSKDLISFSDTFDCLDSDRFYQYAIKASSILKDLSFMIYDGYDCEDEMKAYESCLDASKTNFRFIIPLAKMEGLEEAKKAYVKLVKKSIALIERNLFYLEKFYLNFESRTSNFQTKKRTLESLLLIISDFMEMLAQNPTGMYRNMSSDSTYYLNVDLSEEDT